MGCLFAGVIVFGWDLKEIFGTLNIRFRKHQINISRQTKYFYKAFPSNICWFWRHLPSSSSKTSWRRLAKTSLRRLGRQKIVTLKTSWKCLEEVLKTCLEDVLKTCLEEVLKTCLEDFLKVCLEDDLKICLEDVLKTLWTQTKYLVGISVSNKSKCVSNKFIFHKSIFDNSKANLKCIN